MSVLLLSFAVLSSDAAAQSLTPAQRADVRKLRNLVIDAESQIDRMEMSIAEWKTLGSQVGNSRVERFNSYNDAFVKAFQAGSQIAPNLPGSDATVADLVKRLNDSLAKYNALTAEAKAMLEGAQQAVEDVGGRGAIQADIERIDAIAYQFIPFEAFMVSEPNEALKLLDDYQPALTEIADFERKYAEFLKMNNADTAPVARKLEEAKRRLQGVATAARNRVGEVRDAAERDLDTAAQMTRTAVEERRPLYFKPEGGVRQHLESARARLLLARSVDSNATAALVERYDQVKQQAQRAAASLKSEIIQSNRVPADRYRGDDADVLKAGAKQAWLEANPGDEVVAVSLVGEDWDRETKWTWWRDAFYFSDRSDLQAAVIVKGQGEDGTLELHRFSVDIAKDHTENDRLRYSPWQKQSAADMPIENRILPENL